MCPNLYICFPSGHASPISGFPLLVSYSSGIKTRVNEAKIASLFWRFHVKDCWSFCQNVQSQKLAILIESQSGLSSSYSFHFLYFPLSFLSLGIFDWFLSITIPDDLGFCSPRVSSHEPRMFPRKNAPSSM